MSWLSSLIHPGNQAADDANAERARIQAQEAKRVADIGQGKTAIDQAFSGFNDPYYDTFKHNFLDTYNPQLKDQYNLSRDKLTATLAGRDMLESGVGAHGLSQLDKTRDNAEVDIGNKATDATNGMRSTVDATKTNLYGMNAAAADPLAAASQAQAQAGAIVAPQSYPGLGDVFAGALAPFASGMKTNSQSMNPWRGQSGVNVPNGNGSAIFG